VHHTCAGLFHIRCLDGCACVLVCLGVLYMLGWVVCRCLFLWGDSFCLFCLRRGWALTLHCCCVGSYSCSFV